MEHLKQNLANSPDSANLAEKKISAKVFARSYRRGTSRDDLKFRSSKDFCTISFFC